MLYRNITIFDSTCFDSDKNIKILSVEFCSYEKLKECIKDKDKTVRLKAFIRLGPNKYYKVALKDRAKSIRKWAIMLSPSFDKSLSKMYNEKSAYNFEELVKKVNKKDMPYFLSPSLLKNKSVSDYVKKRIRHEIKRRLN